MDITRDPILIAGPTASGKSALAMALAEACGGEIINADSMQVYRGLPILSAGPSPAMRQQVPHHLYAHIAPEQAYSVGQWLADLAVILDDLRQRRRPAIIVGGTGLYFRAALSGLVELPDIPARVRQDLEVELEQHGLAHLYARLCADDPRWAQQIHPHDRQRILRGLEVVMATGQPLSQWQASATAPALIGSATRLCLMPERKWLYARCDARFEAMMAEGAVAEVAQFEQAHPKSRNIRKTLGFSALARLIAGEVSQDEARAQAKTETRRYAKRQMTWNRNQMITWRVLSETDYFNNMPKILSEITKNT